MLLEPTLTQLRDLRLTGMAAALEEQQAVPDVQSLSFEDRLALLVEREATVRQDRRLTRLLGQAKLRLPASIEDLDLRSPRPSGSTRQSSQPQHRRLLSNYTRRVSHYC